MKRRIEVGTIVEVDYRPEFGAAGGKNWVDAEVLAILDRQFTVEVEGTHRFLFYLDQGDSWRHPPL